MTDQHSITPPPELVQQWVAEIWHEGTPVRVALSDEHIATRAAQWGADTELEAVLHLCDEWLTAETIRRIRATRRPKPPSLKDEAIGALLRFMADDGHDDCPDEVINDDFNIIRRALEALPE